MKAAEVFRKNNRVVKTQSYQTTEDFHFFLVLPEIAVTWSDWSRS